MNDSIRQAGVDELTEHELAHLMSRRAPPGLVRDGDFGIEGIDPPSINISRARVIRGGAAVLR